MADVLPAVDDSTKVFVDAGVKSANFPDADDTKKGLVELATTAETTTGTDTARAVTPAGVKAVADTKAALSHTHNASDVNAGTLAAARLPAATTSAVGAVELATTTEAATGTDTSRAVTPAGVAAYGHQGYAAVNTVAASGSTETLSGANALHKVTMDQNCTFTFTSPTAGASFALLLSGAFTPTFPATVDWPDGTPPTYSTPSVYVFTTWDAGTTWYGVQAGKAFA